MRIYKLILLTTITFCIISCDNLNSNQATLEKEKEQLKIEREQFEKEKELAEKERELEEEKELLEREKEEFVQEKSQQEKPRVVQIVPDKGKKPSPAWSPNKIAGVWDVKMNATKSDCERYPAGSIMVEQWNIGYENGKMVATVRNSKTSIKGYKGSLKGSTLKLSTSTLFSKVKINLSLQSPFLMKGTRKVSNSNCSIEYYLELRKSS